MKKDCDKDANIIPNGTFMWGGYYRTNWDIDFKNDMIYMLNTQREPYAAGIHAAEYNKFRVLTHQALVEVDK